MPHMGLKSPVCDSQSLVLTVSSSNGSIEGTKLS